MLGLLQLIGIFVANLFRHFCKDRHRPLCVPNIRFDIDAGNGPDKLAADDRSAQPDSRRAGFALQVESRAGSRNPDPTAADQCASPADTEATASQQLRSFSVRLAVSLVPLRPGRGCDCQAGDDHSWHRTGFRVYWRWRSRNHVGRPRVSAELRTLIDKMSRANLLWGAPHIHGELLKLGFEIAQSTVARYMCRHSRPPSQGWRTFLSNHAEGIAAVDLFVLPTITFQILYCLVVIRHGRRIWCRLA